MDINNIINIVTFIVVFGLVAYLANDVRIRFRDLTNEVRINQSSNNQELQRLTPTKPTVYITQLTPRKWEWNYHYPNVYSGLYGNYDYGYGRDIEGTATTYAAALAAVQTAIAAGNLNLPVEAPEAPPASASTR